MCERSGPTCPRASGIGSIVWQPEQPMATISSGPEGPGAAVGSAVGADVGVGVGAAVGSAAGADVGVGVGVGAAVGSAVGADVGVGVGVGAEVGVGSGWVQAARSTAPMSPIVVHRGGIVLKSLLDGVPTSGPYAFSSRYSHR